MTRTSNRFGALIPLALAAVAAVAALAQQAGRAQTASKIPERAVRHDIPLTNMIRRAFDAGTRDSTGRPGRNYWQLWMDYTINARFEPTTSMITGRETAVIHNQSDSAMRTIVLRLDQNFFAPNVVRAEEATEITEGMKLSKLTVNGEAVDLNPPPVGRGGGGGGGGAASPAVRLAAVGLNTTSARIQLPNPIAAKGSATIEAEG